MEKGATPLGVYRDPQNCPPEQIHGLPTLTIITIGNPHLPFHC
jgi:hypothetical protein